mmetsp:Transcript_14863/g.46540  ORF Transcript_14863/g.46540 Transcript_14863/m.46540 type:complete len:205 (+) Transcript_14863:251-865(+)
MIRLGQFAMNIWLTSASSKINSKRRVTSVKRAARCCEAPHAHADSQQSCVHGHEQRQPSQSVDCPERGWPTHGTGRDCGAFLPTSASAVTSVPLGKFPCSFPRNTSTPAACLYSNTSWNSCVSDVASPTRTLSPRRKPSSAPGCGGAVAVGCVTRSSRSPSFASVVSVAVALENSPCVLSHVASNGSWTASSSAMSACFRLVAM